ncbi:hypothetical protein NEDG_02206 [Nematocida displodere]|uniref:Uncharacterized protein n=1 Tax=Nematocida displodere TaxID=1805483 RepID=A0A177EFC5_9MICR|nr:hypothetical protein NEDG_02206 [Nematocida displodere]
MMKSTPVRSFGKVFETSLGKRLGRVIGKALRCRVLCLIVFCMAVGCADEVSVPEYIASPYTEQTMEFFEKSRPDLPKRNGFGSADRQNMLVTVEIDGQRCLLKKQREIIYINPKNYTLETVPEHLVQGIEFNILTIAPGDEHKIARTNPDVLEKILNALGTICADTLLFYHLDLDGSGSGNKIQRMTRSVRRIGRWSSGNFGRKETPELVPAITRYILSIKTLWIQHNTLPAIVWLQKRLNLSHCRINLTILGKLQLDNLEVLDGFDAGSIEALTLKYVKRLDSLECKLLREGPLPEELAISTTKPIFPKIPEQIAYKIIAKEWRCLEVPMVMWRNLMSPGRSPKLFIAAELMICIPQYGGAHTMLPAPSLPVMGDNIARVNSLIVYFSTIGMG